MLKTWVDVKGSGHCRDRDVREYRCTCGGRAVQGLRMSLLVFAMTQNGRRIEWTKGATRADTLSRPQAAKRWQAGWRYGNEALGGSRHSQSSPRPLCACIHLHPPHPERLEGAEKYRRRSLDYSLRGRSYAEETFVT